MNNSNWVLTDSDSYVSYHLLTTYLGEKVPIYHIILDPDNKGWIIGMFYGFTGGEYVPLEEDGEEQLVFSIASEAMNYVDSVLVSE